MTDITLAPVQPDQPTHLMATYGRQAISFVRGRGRIFIHKMVQNI